MNRVQELAEQLQAKRKGLADIFAAHPDMNLSEEQIADVRARNDELTDLGKKYDTLREAEEIAEANRKFYEAGQAPVNRVPFPGAEGAPRPASEPRQAEPPVSLGDQFIGSKAYKGYTGAGGGSYTQATELPFTPGFKTTMDTATGFAPQAVRIPRLQPFALRRPVVADLIPDGVTTQTAVVYMEETTFTNNAAGVLEGGTKPEAALGFTERTAPVRKIAVTLPVTDELMADAPAMRDYINARLSLMIQLKEEDYLISGTGTAPQITGLLNVSGIQTQAVGTDPVPDAIYKAMVLIQTVAFSEPSGVLMNPLDWQDIRLLRTTQGLYIWGNPSDAGPERIWGLPVVVTTAMTQNTAIVADFQMAMQIFRRQGLTLEVTNSHDQDFVKNLLRIRAEERLAFAVYRPAAICTVTGV